MGKVSKEFMGSRYLLKYESTKRLYDSFASGQPIYDYYWHLDAKEILRSWIERRSRSLACKSISFICCTFWAMSTPGKIG